MSRQHASDVVVQDAGDGTLMEQEKTPTQPWLPSSCRSTTGPGRGACVPAWNKGARACSETSGLRRTASPKGLTASLFLDTPSAMFPRLPLRLAASSPHAGFQEPAAWVQPTALHGKLHDSIMVPTVGFWVSRLCDCGIELGLRRQEKVPTMAWLDNGLTGQWLDCGQ
ncbi:hypothetical protein ACJQWK_04667 [Exserohilum turcicum]